MVKDRKQVISLTVEPELVKFLNKKANERFTSVSQYIRSLIGMEYQKECLEKGNYSEDELTTSVVNNVNEF